MSWFNTRPRGYRCPRTPEPTEHFTGAVEPKGLVTAVPTGQAQEARITSPEAANVAQEEPALRVK